MAYRNRSVLRVYAVENQTKEGVVIQEEDEKNVGDNFSEQLIYS